MTTHSPSTPQAAGWSTAWIRHHLDRMTTDTDDTDSEVEQTISVTTREFTAAHTYGRTTGMRR
jgi:hypothetical protein